MVNVKTEVKGNSLILTIDLSARGERSASGKTIIVAKTEGPEKVGGTDVTLNMQLWKKP